MIAALKEFYFNIIEPKLDELTPALINEHHDYNLICFKMLYRLISDI
jgi:hypothetical protein